MKKKLRNAELLSIRLIYKLGNALTQTAFNWEQRVNAKYIREDKRFSRLVDVAVQPSMGPVRAWQDGATKTKAGLVEAEVRFPIQSIEHGEPLKTKNY